MYIALIILHPLARNLISLLVLTSCFDRLIVAIFTSVRVLGCNLISVRTVLID